MTLLIVIAITVAIAWVFFLVLAIALGRAASMADREAFDREGKRESEQR